MHVGWVEAQLLFCHPGHNHQSTASAKYGGRYLPRDRHRMDCATPKV